MREHSLARRTAANAFWNVLGSLLCTAIVVVAFPYYFRKLGSEQFGILILINSISGMLGIASSGLVPATVKHVAEYKGRGDFDAINQVLGLSTALFLFLGVSGGAMVFVLAPFLARLFGMAPENVPLAASALRVGAAAFFAGILFSLSVAVPQALQKFQWLNWLRIGRTAAVYGLGVLALWSGYGLTSLVAVNAGATMCFVVLGFIVAKKLLPHVSFRPRRLARSVAASLGKFVGFATINNAGNLLLHSADKVLIGALAGAAVLPYYAVPASLCLRTKGLLASMGRVAFPLASELKGKGDTARLRTLYDRATWVITTLVLVTFVTLFFAFKPLLVLWMGEEFAQEAAGVAPLVALAACWMGLSVVPGVLLNGIGMPWANSLAVTFASVVSLALTVVLIPRVGLLGAGIGLNATVLLAGTRFFLLKTRGFPDLSWAGFLRPFAGPLLSAMAMIPPAIVVRQVLGYGPPWAPLVGWPAFAFAFCCLVFLIELVGGGTAGRLAVVRQFLRRSRNRTHVSRVLENEPGEGPQAEA